MVYGRQLFELHLLCYTTWMTEMTILKTQLCFSVIEQSKGTNENP